MTGAVFIQPSADELSSPEPAPEASFSPPVPQLTPNFAELGEEELRVKASYDGIEIFDTMYRFGLELPFSDANSRRVTEADLQEKLDEYAADVTQEGVYNDQIKIPLFRTAFERVIVDMNAMLARN